MDAASVIVSTTCVAASTPLAMAAVRAYRSYGGLRVVTCPETVEAAIVKIHATRAIASKLAGRNELPLRSCSRWPERQGCGQECCAQLAAAPGGCRSPRAGPVTGAADPITRREARALEFGDVRGSDPRETLTLSRGSPACRRRTGFSSA